jgi:hypothetical protein
MRKSIDTVPRFMPCTVAAYHLFRDRRPCSHVLQSTHGGFAATLELGFNPRFRLAVCGLEEDQKASVRRSVVPDDGRCKCYTCRSLIPEAALNEPWGIDVELLQRRGTPTAPTEPFMVCLLR